MPCATSVTCGRRFGPNGPRRPYDLNRLELRICDLVTNPDQLLAITCLLELRLLALKNTSKASIHSAVVR